MCSMPRQSIVLTRPMSPHGGQRRGPPKHCAPVLGDKGLWETRGPALQGGQSQGGLWAAKGTRGWQEVGTWSRVPAAVWGPVT